MGRLPRRRRLAEPMVRQRLGLAGGRPGAHPPGHERRHGHAQRLRRLCWLRRQRHRGAAGRQSHRRRLRHHHRQRAHRPLEPVGDAMGAGRIGEGRGHVQRHGRRHDAPVADRRCPRRGLLPQRPADPELRRRRQRHGHPGATGPVRRRRRVGLLPGPGVQGAGAPAQLPGRNEALGPNPEARRQPDRCASQRLRRAGTPEHQDEAAHLRSSGAGLPGRPGHVVRLLNRRDGRRRRRLLCRSGRPLRRRRLSLHPQAGRGHIPAAPAGVGPARRRLRHRRERRPPDHLRLRRQRAERAVRRQCRGGRAVQRRAQNGSRRAQCRAGRRSDAGRRRSGHGGERPAQGLPRRGLPL